MSDANSEGRDESDPPSFSAEIDALCDRFEADWKARAPGTPGRRPQIQDYLCQVPEPARANLFRHLLALELHYRKAAGETPELAQYRERFPDYLAAVADAFPTIDSRAATDRPALQAGLPPSPHALHIRCPHCRNAIEVLDDRPLAEIVCPSCGSNFSLVGDEALAFQSEGGSLHRRQAFGHFELIEQLGAGAFGAVWKAKDTQLDRMVALKIPRKGQLSPEEAEKFVREARAAAQLQHPGIVSVYEVGREGETLYIVSEFVEGLSLADWLTGQRPNYRESAELCVKIADALHHAHEHGVIHRDLKPSNVMLDRKGEPHVMDFGLAKREAGEITMTVEGQIMGTPAYMSPEQAKGEGHTADRRSDVYSLGVILFELVTGERPFRGNVRMLLVQVAGDEPPSPRKLDSRIPRDLETVCLKCMEKDPGRRYATAQEFANDLRHFLAGEPINARPVSGPERLWRWCKRQPVIAGLGSAVAISMLLGTLLSSSFAISAIAQREKAEKQLLRSERLLYSSGIASALREWEANNFIAAWQHLDACRSDFRGWEHDYVYTLFTKNQRTLRGHGCSVFDVAFSPDGKRFASVGWDQNLKIWDAATRQVTRTIATTGCDRIAFSTDGQRIVGGHWGGWLRMWDVASGQIMRTFTGHSGANCAVLSPDGKWIVSGHQDNTLKLWDAMSGQERFTLKGHTSSVSSVAFSSDGKRIVSGTFNNTLKVWDAMSGREILTLKGQGSGTFSPDGKKIVSGGPDNTLKVWDAASGDELLTLKGHTDGVWSVAFSPDGKRIVSGSRDNTLRVWDATTGKEIITLRGHAAAVSGVAFSPDAKHILSGSYDERVKIWDPTVRPGTPTLAGHAGPVTCVAFSPDGMRLVSASEDGTLKIWDVTSEAETLTLKGHAGGVWFASFSPDGKRIVSAGKDKTLKVWDATTGRTIFTLEGFTGEEHNNRVLNVGFSPDGKWIRSCNGAGPFLLRVWDAATGNEAPSMKRFIAGVPSMAFSPDGRSIVSGSSRNAVVWDATSGRQTLALEGLAGQLESVAFSPDGKRIVGAGNRRLQVWDAASGKELLAFRGHNGQILCLAFTPDGKRIVSGGEDKMLRIWDATSGLEVLTLKGHADGGGLGKVLSVAVSPDGKRIVSAGDDKIVKIWEATDSQ